MTSNTETVTISRAEYQKLTSQEAYITELEQQNTCLLMEQLRLSKKKIFGSSSERTKAELVGQLSLVFNEAEAYQPKDKATPETAVAAAL